jgi:hypothetical protein
MLNLINPTTRIDMNMNPDELKGYRQAVEDIRSIISDIKLLDQDYSSATFSFTEIKKGADIMKSKILEKI